MGSYTPVLESFFTTLDTRTSSTTVPIKLGDSMQTFLDALRIAHGIAFPVETTRKFMFNGEDIIPYYQRILSKLGSVTNEGPITIDGKTEQKMPRMMQLDFNTTQATLTDVSAVFTSKGDTGVNYLITKEPANLIYGNSNGLVNTTTDVTFDTYVSNLKMNLSSMLEQEVFDLYTKKLSDLKGLSMPNNNHDIYETSLFDLLMDFVDSNTTIANTTTGTENTRQNNVITHLKNINEFFNTMKSDASDDLNQMIVNINDQQLDIQSKKDSIKQVKEKLYTLMSRDKNYSSVLQQSKRKYYVFMLIFIIICVVYGFALISKKLELDMKNNVVGSVAVAVLVIQILGQLLGMIKQRRIKESFSTGEIIETPNVFIVINNGNINVAETFVNFIDKYNENMTHEVKSEYYESITDKQEKDSKMLEQLHKENETQKYLHQLKNSLTYFKINEMKEYNRMVTYAIVLASLLAILYLAVLNKAIDEKIFVIVATLSSVLYVTFVLLSVKGIMLRDKYDWHRLNWTMNNMIHVSNQERCSLPGR